MMVETTSAALDKLEERHLRSPCSDGDCWCKDEDYWKRRLGDNY